MRAAGAELRALRKREYPPFVYQRDERAGLDGYLPIFALHSVTPTDLEAKLSFLRRNEYATISLDTAVAWMNGEETLPDRAVALTIDDGRRSTWTVAGPLLSRYGMVATAFVIPGYVEEGPPRPTLEDEWSGELEAGALETGETEDRGTVLRWSEVEALHRAGVVAVESHTMLHKQVAVSARLVDFVNPSHIDGIRYEVPLTPAARTGWSATDLATRLGLPIFESAPLLSVREACLVTPEVGDLCVSHAEREGSPEFFERPTWRRELTGLVREATKDTAVRTVETAAHQQWELEAAKRELEVRLPEKTVTHLCLPKGAGQASVAALAAGTGHHTVVWGLLPASETNRRECDPFRLGRLKHDFIYRLPGEGRRSLTRILGEKLRRRVRDETGY